MRRRRIAAMALWGIGLTACGADVRSSPEQSGNENYETVDEDVDAIVDGAEDGSTRVDERGDDDADGEERALAPVTATSVEGTWIFSHVPDGWGEAIIQGNATIESGCLRVRGLVVLWHKELEAYAKDLVQSVVTGDTPTVHTVGGAYPPPFIPTEITERCGPQEFILRTGPETQ